MNEFSQIGILLFTVAGSCAFAMLLVENRRRARQVDELTRKLDIFLETSIGVARTVDRLTVHGPTESPSTVASRRWIVAEAKQRVSDGESLKEVIAPLGLSRDEESLLRSTPPRQRPQSREFVRSSI